MNTDLVIKRLVALTRNCITDSDCERLLSKSGLVDALLAGQDMRRDLLGICTATSILHWDAATKKLKGQ